MTHDDILHQLPEYVLGLLSPQQLGDVALHVSQCTTCQRALRRERQLGHLIQSTVEAAGTPNNARIRSLMPTIPQKRRLLPDFGGWQKQLAPALLLFLLIIAGFTLNSMLPAGSVPSLVATAHAATATSTHSPTATLAQSLPENEKIDHLSKETYSSVIDTALSMPAPSSDSPVETPDPLPTPVAAVRLISAQ